jgi:hypothetical protein
VQVENKPPLADLRYIGNAIRSNADAVDHTIYARSVIAQARQIQAMESFRIFGIGLVEGVKDPSASNIEPAIPLLDVLFHNMLTKPWARFA